MTTSRKTKAGGVPPAATGVGSFGVPPGFGPPAVAEWDYFFGRLVPHAVGVPPEWSRHATPGRWFHDRGFERSFRFALAVAGDVGAGGPGRGGVGLVHGAIGDWWEHAWVELPGGVVFDGVFQRFYARGGYYEAAAANPWYVVTPAAALLILRSLPPGPDGGGRFGGWDRHLDLPWSDGPQDVLRIGAEEAFAFLAKSGLARLPPEHPRLRSAGRTPPRRR